MIRVFHEHHCEISKRVFCIIVKAPPVNISHTLCEGILKRVFSKQICFTYRVEAFTCSQDCFRIYFRFVCWNADGQRERYKKFRKMPQDKLEENVLAHSKKTIDNFVGEFFKRLKRKKYNVEINEHKAELIEDPTKQEIHVKTSWVRKQKHAENED